MGRSITWLAVKGLSEKELLTATHLKKTGETTKSLDVELSFLNLENGWLLIGQQNCGDFYTQHEKLLQKLSKKAEVLAFYVQENVMISALHCYASGKRSWIIERDSQMGEDHLIAEGEVPAIYDDAQSKAQRHLDQADNDNIDFLIDVPEEVGDHLSGISLAKLDNSRFEKLTATPKSPLAPRLLLELKLVSAFDELLEREGFIKCKEDLYKLSINDDFSVFFGLDKDRRWGLVVKPWVGLRYEKLGSLLTNFLDPPYVGPYGCGFHSNVGNLRTNPSFLQEDIENEQDLAKVTEIYSVVEEFGIPFLRQYSTTSGYALCLIETDSTGYTWTRITQLPALRLLDGNIEEGVRLCKLYLEAYKDENHVLAEGFREYAARFLTYVDNL